MIVDTEKYRRFTLNQRPCAPTQARPIFFLNWPKAEHNVRTMVALNLLRFSDLLGSPPILCHI